MGQYYVIANFDKEEYLHPHEWGIGMKLTEFSYFGNYLSTALLNLLKGRWNGDRVYLIGDYVDLSDPKENWYSTAKALCQELPLKSPDYTFVGGEYNLQDYVIQHFKHLSMSQVGHKRTTAHYVYNHGTKEVLCLDHCPAFHIDPNGYQWKIAPLNLLLAMGNGRGGGDYRGHNEELVGSWVNASEYLEVTTHPLPAHAMFREIHPNFHENW